MSANRIGFRTPVVRVLLAVFVLARGGAFCAEAGQFYITPPGESIEMQDLRAPDDVGLTPEIVNQLKSRVKSGHGALWQHRYLVHVEGEFNRKTEVKSLRKTRHALNVGATVKQQRIPSIKQTTSVWCCGLTGKHANTTWRHVMAQTSGFLGGLIKHAAEKAEAPYPPSPVIRGISWHAETLKTAAPGSDLWPVTWGPDGHIYTSWGDGGGFGGTNSDGRVSMGFARIGGPPEKYVAININGGKNGKRPASFPRRGKTGGIVFVDGVLYAWLNQQDGNWPSVNHSLIWSNDRGATWKQSSWQWPKGEENFKPNTFLQFGRDYTGARDDYVYFYGRNETAWAKGTHGYLGRVHRRQLKTRDAYEVYAGLHADGTPIWSRDVSKRKPHFTDPAGVEGIQVVYHPATNRYLMTAHHGAQGTLGIFDAPEPWGPWTTVAYYDNWLELKGSGAKREMLFINIPSKWISADGKTLWVIFTGGQDRFNLVKATLSLK